jgi:hypothetical protein
LETGGSSICGAKLAGMSPNDCSNEEKSLIVPPVPAPSDWELGWEIMSRIRHGPTISDSPKAPGTRRRRDNAP